MTWTPVHRRKRAITFDRFPTVPAGTAEDCVRGWDAICATIRGTGARVVVLETYPGVLEKDVLALVQGLAPDLVVDAADALKSPEEIERLVGPELGDDPVFGRMTSLRLEDLLDAGELERLRVRVADAQGTVVVHGVGASLIAPDGLLVYADMPRWEGQLRQRRNEAGNIGARNEGDDPMRKYKRSYFVDWRLCDRLKETLWERMAFVLDTVVPGEPKMIRGETFLRALAGVARRPFSVVPYFDPAPWGGHWMQTVCGLDPDAINFGWSFNCVPEENSLLLGFGDTRFEIPSLDLVLREPRALLGEDVYARFGAEFPIRFDFLDTMGGGNLSLQVHPLTAYIRERFGMSYTQDESYYIVDADEGAVVHLGVLDGVDRAAMERDLRRAQEGEIVFPHERYVNRFPTKPHDHFLIPAGTLHGSGAGTMVLEISATPYIFTFKLWDWGRLGLNGRPRPIHIDHGMRNLQWHRDTTYARARLINRIERLAEGDGWVEERTGLHEAEFIETRRHRFTAPVPHDTAGTVHVLCLVEGEEVVVESPDGAFDPFVAHFAETFIVPASVGPYTVRPHGRGEGMEHATIRAHVRPGRR